ncbi:hypothetical protein ACQ4M4_21855 [Leptolyngbya sp. AN02str]|uniref:hypothetical protein n=1 Tax=Leptolyngbya sp. AN02str TaxID=3423363 RepID=UPI003D31A516
MPSPCAASYHHVHRVHLWSTHAPLVQRGAILIEDALHTASLPTAERLVLVRQLQLGIIRSDRSSASLALTIEQQMAQLAGTAVYALDAAAVDAAMVYFNDALEPYYQLALRLALGFGLEAWFWPLAVRGWHRGMDRASGLRYVLQSLLQTESGSLAVVPLLQVLQEHHQLTALLQVLLPSDGAVLMQASGWPWPLSSLSQVASPSQLNPANQMLLSTWVQHWGSCDARSHWLAAILWVAENPGRVLASDVGERSRILVHQGIATLDMTSALLPPIETNPDEPFTSATAQAVAPFLSEDGAAPMPTPYPADESAQTQPTVALPHPIAPALQPLDAGRLPSACNNAVPPEQVALASVAPVLPPAQSSTCIAGTVGTDLPTHYGGFFFLLPLLNRLAIVSFLQSHPGAIEANFAQHLLRITANRLGIPQTDPIYQTLFSPDAWEPLPQWTIPAHWLNHQLISSPWKLRQTLIGSQLWDSSGQICLAQWQQAKAPTMVHRLLSRGREHIVKKPLITRAPAQWNGSSDPLLQTWQMALQRLCCRYGRMGLRRLVYRPGRLKFTRTHLDVTLPLEQAEVGIRRAGLDLNPGWVPWFGRVVQFHYQERR